SNTGRHPERTSAARSGTLASCDTAGCTHTANIHGDAHPNLPTRPVHLETTLCQEVDNALPPPDRSPGMPGVASQPRDPTPTGTRIRLNNAPGGRTTDYRSRSDIVFSPVEPPRPRTAERYPWLPLAAAIPCPQGLGVASQ